MSYIVPDRWHGDAEAAWTVAFSSRSGFNDFAGSEVTCCAARALYNKKNIMHTVCSIAKNIAEMHDQNSEVNVSRQW